MPNSSRMRRNRRTASSYKASVTAKAVTIKAGYLARTGAFQRTTSHATATMTGRSTAADLE